MTDAALGLTMLSLIVVVILLGFPTAFTLMGLGMMFGFVAFYDPGQPWLSNRIFDLMVQRAYGAMNNDTLLSIPLFVLMGYIMERGALVDRMFHSVQLAFRRLPGSLAVTTLVICTFWGIASGLVGAVVVLMGVIAMRPMLKAGYDVRLASGVITAGGTLGILIPPSVMIIVYAAVAGQSVVKLYAAAMFPGFFLAFLYLVYVIGWALINPKVAPQLPLEQQRAPISPAVALLAERYSPRLLWALCKAVLAPAGAPMSWTQLLLGLLRALVPVWLALVCLGSTWWYVTIYTQKAEAPTAAPAAVSAPANSNSGGLAEPPGSGSGLAEPPGSGSGLSEPPGALKEPGAKTDGGGLERMEGSAAAPHAEAVPESFYTGFAVVCALTALLLAWYYWRFDAEQYEILNMLVSSVMPLGILTLVVLGVILFGITTATESAAVGAAGAFLMAWQAGTLDFKKIQQAVFLTAKTTAMVCWLFVGSALFSAVFALLGGQALVEQWVMGMNLTPLQFMLLSQAIIFVLGWPLEWTEIIVIFVPIFLPLLAHFQIDPMLWGTLVFVNLQAAFLSPPVAMSAFYLKGVSPPHVTLNQIFAGMMPYMLIVILCMVFMYVWPGMTLWLPGYLYGR
ncbi:TRAP-type mannitol/chloroaromatic compound transport system permease large subunit [Pelomonas saccharophila]|uniref:TRAP-type mannitol/chloroaromatic compound transport system permease large subunit n=1 Tax=Roseateles saccharophilus TaxID=304 RepID=A0ABU1YND1_ROSSA|nr:TRAP transporter large permease subunit [Roseateles saccharophilus]MDR7270369.1 TRAP-type mannitol/chloroaromatic compound transport system permease large subunit [Roseateles saccharophilus]